MRAWDREKSEGSGTRCAERVSRESRFVVHVRSHALTDRTTPKTCCSMVSCMCSAVIICCLNMRTPSLGAGCQPCLLPPCKTLAAAPCGSFKDAASYGPRAISSGPTCTATRVRTRQFCSGASSMRVAFSGLCRLSCARRAACPPPRCQLLLSTVRIRPLSPPHKLLGAPGSSALN
jgi:hypothetical protein